MNGSDALCVALRLLTVRERSEAELSRRLQQKGFTAEAIAEVLQRCRRWGYLDDARFARERARALVQNGRAVGPRVLADLRMRGVSEALAREALAEVTAGTDEETLLAELFERRFAGFDAARATDKERRRVLNYFLRRGFSLATVLTFFNARER